MQGGFYMPTLEIKGFKKSFGKTEVLKGVNFSMEEGEVLSVIGSSGSGKTTLLRCINFLERADEGQIFLDGKLLFSGDDKVKLSAAEMRSKQLNFGLVFQSFNLFPQYTATENITLAPTLLLSDEVKEMTANHKAALCKLKKQISLSKGDKQKLSELKRNYKELKKAFPEKKKTFIAGCKEEILSSAQKIIEKVGLKDKADAYPSELSGGQQQRVAIARALALKPKVLCFDEPTSALDPELTGEVLKVIRELKDNEGMTMIIVTHEMEFAKEVSDKSIFIADGVIAEQGVSSEMFNAPKTVKLQQFLSRSLK